MNSLPRLDAGRVLAEALGASGDAPRSALSGHPWLLVELEPHALPQGGERAALARWLRHQACPVIGIAARGVEHPLAFACDTVVVDAAQAGQLVANIELGQSVMESGIPTGPMRAPRSNGLAFVFQSFFDELAHRAGRDPVEFLAALLGEPRVLVNSTGKPDALRDFNTGRMRDVLHRVAEMSNW